MSIRDALKANLDAGNLVEVTPILGSGAIRKVYAVPEVFAQLEPSTAENEFISSSGQLRRWLDSFIIGRRLVVGPRRSRTCDMKRLEPAADEVWEIRKQEAPSARLFGRFLATDELILTNMELVSTLFGRDNAWVTKATWLRKKLTRWPIWRREIRNCKSAWRRLFPTYPPHTGSALSDYLSRADPEGGSW